jgi:predicted HAD superfamily Cof-like phosphohydrolase
MAPRADMIRVGENAPVSPSSLVREFNTVMGISMPAGPDARLLGDRRLTRKIIRMLQQEVREVKAEIDRSDLEGVGRELADVVYSAYGAALELGIDLDEMFLRVHSANLTRRSPAGEVQRTRDGKIAKGPHYVPPDA